jgi:hypothetical protein
VLNFPFIMDNFVFSVCILKNRDGFLF